MQAIGVGACLWCLLHKIAETDPGSLRPGPFGGAFGGAPGGTPGGVVRSIIEGSASGAGQGPGARA